MRSKIILLMAMLFISFSVFSFSGSVQGQEIQEGPVLEVEVLGIKQVGNETETEEEGEEDLSIWETIEKGITTTITTLFEVLLSPFKAMATVFENWSETISGPLGLLIAGGVLFLLYLLIRFTGVVDMFLDRLN